MTPEIRSHVLFQLSQPGTPMIVYLNKYLGLQTNMNL